MRLAQLILLLLRHPLLLLDHRARSLLLLQTFAQLLDLRLPLGALRLGLGAPGANRRECALDVTHPLLCAGTRVLSRLDAVVHAARTA